MSDKAPANDCSFSSSPDSDTRAVFPNGRGNPIIWSLVGSLLGLILLYAATRKIDAADVGTILHSASSGSSMAVLGLTIVFVFIKAWRWGLLLRFAPDCPFRDRHLAVYIGLAVNFVVSHAGEFVRTAIISRCNGIAPSAVLASVFVERLLDFLALLAILAATGVLAHDMPDLVKSAGILAALAIISAVVIVYLILHPPRLAASLGAKLGRVAPGIVVDWLADQLSRSRDGFASISNYRLMLLAVVASIVQWSLVVVAIWYCGLSIGVNVSGVAVIVTFILIVFGLTLPNAPLQLGVTQLSFTVGFALDGIDAATAVAASVVYTVFLILPIMIVGFALLLRGNFMALLRRNIFNG